MSIWVYEYMGMSASASSVGYLCHFIASWMLYLQSFSQFQTGAQPNSTMISIISFIINRRHYVRTKASPRRLGTSMSAAAFSFDTRASIPVESHRPEGFPHFLSEHCYCCTMSFCHHFDKGPVDCGTSWNLSFPGCWCYYSSSPSPSYRAFFKLSP